MSVNYQLPQTPNAQARYVMVALKDSIEMMDHLAERIKVEPGKSIAHGIGAGGRAPEALLPSPPPDWVAQALLHCVKAWLN
jgi:hypothetical protein